MDVTIGIRQPELYAQFELSTAGAAAAAGCGAIPGAVDAKVNADRAKVAEEIVRPLKDAVVDLTVDRLPTKTVSDKAYEETFKASEAGSVMFANVEYHLSKDFGSLKVSARSLLFPRSAAGLSQESGARLLKEDLERDPTAEPQALSKVELSRGVFADVLAERDGGKLLRMQNGAMLFQARTPALATAETTASATPAGTAQ